jgi:4-amino-4-deoxy-L-arabinose transferase-like glycosyltransferase
MEKIKQFWLEKPLQSILIIALTLRLLAVFFAQGYGMHDDHFLVIEASQSWADGTDYNNWLPKNQINPKPEGHSFFYVGLHFLIFSFFKVLGISDPAFKMLLIRLLHALFSLLVVYYGFKIAEKFSNIKVATQVGLLLATLWFMPFLSVRNLVEVVCIPFLLMSFWILLNAPEKQKYFQQYLIAGLIMGLAFSVRFQTLLYIGGTGLVILFQKKLKEAIVFGLGALISIFAIQGVVDFFIWHRPFAELTEYIVYNIEHKDAYGANNPWMYVELIMGVLIPPIGIFLFFGFFREWKKQLLLFLPTFIFLAFHTAFSNKQERFGFTMFPFFVVLGAIGWNEFRDKSKFWQKWPKLLKGCWTFFWIINLALLPIVTLTFSKKSRVEAMYYFYKKPVQNLIIDDPSRDGAQMMPSFYSGQWMTMYTVSKSDKTDSTLIGKIKVEHRYFIELYDIGYFKIHRNIKPEYVLFAGSTNLDNRVAAMKEIFPDLVPEAKAEPGFIDRLLYKINPNGNKNETFYIYKIN